MIKASRTGVAPQFRLTFPGASIPELATRYALEQSPEEREEEWRLVEQVGLTIRRDALLTKGQFLALCRWKSPRRIRLCNENRADRIEESWRLVCSTSDEALRIGVLMALDGVSWPTASVLLHFGHDDPYPILDVRALETLGVRETNYTYDFWWSYVQNCRALAGKVGVDMRTLDRALWQWSKERARERRRSRRAR